jgi:branched-chain amino acid transport system ATP-binding protein
LAEPLVSRVPILAISHVSKWFGGLRALDDVSLQVERGEIFGLIGPNGAGKTTLFSALVGLHRIDRGTIRFDGLDVSGRKPHRVAALGLTKTFQNVALFAEMSVLDNVLVGALLRHGLPSARVAARACLERVGLDGIAGKRALDLSFPERARVEVARALATEPKLLLLDEVMAALNAAEKRDMIGLIRALREDGLTLIVIEHHMNTIMTLCDRIAALSFGRLLAEGSPAEIARHPAVVEAYLGREHAL